MIRAVVFDFDGVLVDSNAMKRKAFFNIFGAIDGADAVLTKIFEENPSLVRHAVVRKVLEWKGIRGEELEIKVKKYVDEYNNEVQRGITSLGLSEGVSETLEKLSKHYVLFINTATPKNAIDETVNNLGISQYFKEIYGASKNKIENLKEIIAKAGLASNEVVVIGDGENDYEAAKECETHFLGFANDWNKWKKKEFPIVRRFNEIERTLQEL